MLLFSNNILINFIINNARCHPHPPPHPHPHPYQNHGIHVEQTRETTPRQVQGGLRVLQQHSGERARGRAGADKQHEKARYAVH